MEECAVRIVILVLYIEYKYALSYEVLKNIMINSVVIFKMVLAMVSKSFQNI